MVHEAIKWLVDFSGIHQTCLCASHTQPPIVRFCVPNHFGLCTDSVYFPSSGSPWFAEKFSLGSAEYPKFTPRIRKCFGHFLPTVRFLARPKVPKGFCRWILDFVGLFRHLKIFRLLDDGINFQDETAGVLMYSPSFAPPLRRPLTMICFVRVGLLEDIILSRSRIHYFRAFHNLSFLCWVGFVVGSAVCWFVCTRKRHTSQRSISQLFFLPSRERPGLSDERATLCLAYSTLRFREISITLLKTPEPAEIIVTRFFAFGSPAPVCSRPPQSHLVRREMGFKPEASVISAPVTCVCEEQSSSRRFQDFASFHFWQ